MRSKASSVALRNFKSIVEASESLLFFIFQDDPMYEVGLDIKSQLRVFEQIDEVERRKRDARERDILMRAVKVRNFQSISTCICGLRFYDSENLSQPLLFSRIAHSMQDPKDPRRFTCQKVNKGRGSVGRRMTN